VGGLCENNDKFAIDRELVGGANIGDLAVIHDTGAHGHAMGFNYNGKLRSAEYLWSQDGSIKTIRKAETYRDLFQTLPDSCAIKTSTSCCQRVHCLAIPATLVLGLLSLKVASTKNLSGALLVGCGAVAGVAVAALSHLVSKKLQCKPQTVHSRLSHS